MGGREVAGSDVEEVTRGERIRTRFPVIRAAIGVPIGFAASGLVIGRGDGI